MRDWDVDDCVLRANEISPLHSVGGIREGCCDVQINSKVLMKFIEHTSELFYYEYKLILSDSSNLSIVNLWTNLLMVNQITADFGLLILELYSNIN